MGGRHDLSYGDEVCLLEDLMKETDAADDLDRVEAGLERLGMRASGPPETSRGRRVATYYVHMFNLVYGRRQRTDGAMFEEVLKRVSARLDGGIRPEEILVAPLLAMASGFVAEAPDVLLRDGTHRRTSRDGATYGATDHIVKLVGRMDQTKLILRLSRIAREAKLAEWLCERGVVLTEEP